MKEPINYLFIKIYETYYKGCVTSWLYKNIKKNVSLTRYVSFKVQCYIKIYYVLYYVDNSASKNKNL